MSSGNELDLDLADYINFLVDDASTRIIACMVEGIRRPKAFMAAAEKALAAKKPIILVKLGRSEAGQAAAKSHTGAIASDAHVFDAVCRRYGIINVPSLDDLIENCLAFGQGRLPKGPLIAMSCYSGGSKGLALDYASDEGATMAPLTAETKARLKGMIDPGLAAENPLDTGPVVGVRAQKFAEICKVVCADPTVDLVTVQGLMPVNPTDPCDPAPLRGVLELDHQAGAGVRPHLAERLRDQPQVPGRDRRAVHPRPARDHPRAAQPGALCRRAAARAGGARCARRHAAARSAARSMRRSGQHGLTPPHAALAAIAGRRRRQGGRRSAFRWR